VAVEFGPQFEEAIIAIAGLQGLNIDPGSMRIDLLHDPVTTVRFTVVADVPVAAVRAALNEAIQE